MPRRLTDEAIRHMSVFESITGVEAVDCLIDDAFDRVVIVVPSGRIAEAIGPQGETVSTVEQRFNRSVTLIEMADRPEDFVANALRPAAVYDVELEDDGRRARVEVSADDQGAAIGRDGRRIELARELARRHFDIETVELEAVPSS